MKLKLKDILILAVFGLLLSCKDKPKKSEMNKAEIEQEAEQLHTFFKKTYEEDLADSPMMQTQIGLKTNYGKWDDFSHTKYPKDLEKAKIRLAYMNDSINTNALSAADQLSYQLMKGELQHQIDDYQYRFYNYPINQMGGYHTSLPAFLINQHQVDSVIDAIAYIERLNGLKKVFEDVINTMQIREKNGILPPKFVFTKVLEDAKNVITGKPFSNSKENSVLLQDFSDKIEELSIPKKRKQELLVQAKLVLLEKVKPAYQNLINTLEDEDQRATSDHGVWKFPKGKEYYQNRLNRYTTTNYSADKIHAIGLEEVARIHNEMKAIMQQVNFKGSLKDFFKFMQENPQFYYEQNEEGKAAYLNKATSIIDEMRSHLDELFITKPTAKLVVKPVEAFREKSTGLAFYQRPALDGSRPGTYYVNLYDMKAASKYQMEALAYHEGIPGHHMQIAIAQELDSIPEFRKHLFYGAYIEGWGLYSELLPKEIGYYKDPYSDFGRLTAELWRACRLVVDTGIHAKKWTRERAIQYYKDNTPNAESDCIKMVDRHIVLPGQATSYKIGMIKILNLRAKAKKALGEDFDIREFHEVVLTNGVLPLNILETLIEDYIERKKADTF
ncbi:DUF885 domain-containing protein [Mesonia aestuariivivens]|uniref:DUF885 domain-containing protein n=1 Tax=Mesonia aestuariivivens TaxID=2796128 RepID=A0ABS6W3P4_9FLAO|nr:DUF885 domain-containing protein [Mesonia aestuariivivens]MBW2962481.1 DUF885 domain-containing protein [Mesonia aestuariivivens]